MKALKLLTTMTLCLVILMKATSCIVVPRTDNGKHKGWYKNRKNPHNPHSIKPPVKAKGKGKYKR